MPNKNSELVLYRKTEDGGLGLYNVKIRALALLIRTFLETSINPAFKHSLFHEILFRYHVLGEVSLPDPGLPPYYKKDFFDVIRHYHTTSSLNITCMSTKDWYKTLLEDQILMTQPTEQAQSILIPTRVESVQPNNDWTETWRLARIHGLGSNLTSFLFKLLHCLLPTQDSVQKLGVTVDGQPGLCQLCHLESEDALHALVHCPHSWSGSAWACPKCSPQSFTQKQPLDWTLVKNLKRKKNYSMLACHWVALHLGGQSQQEAGAQVQDEG